MLKVRIDFVPLRSEEIANQSAYIHIDSNFNVKIPK